MANLVAAGVKVVSVIAIFMNWGFFPGVLGLVAMFFPYSSTSWGTVDYDSTLTKIKAVAGDIALPIIGVWAVGSMWGAVWAAAMLVIYAVAFMIPSGD